MTNIGTARTPLRRTREALAEAYPPLDDDEESLIKAATVNSLYEATAQALVRMSTLGDRMSYLIDATLRVMPDDTDSDEARALVETIRELHVKLANDKFDVGRRVAELVNRAGGEEAAK